MTKIQKIREEVARIQLYTQSEVLKDILDYIDKVQEEPVSVWNDASKKYPLAGKEIIVLRENKIYYGKYIGGFHRYVSAEIQLTDDTAQTYAIIDYLTKKDKWIYVEDLLNLSNVQITVKNCKEYVSEDWEKEIEKMWAQELKYRDTDYTIAELTKQDYEDCARHFANWQKTKDESCSKELGEYINELSKQFPEVSFAKLSRIAVRVAKWKEEQDKKKEL